MGLVDDPFDYELTKSGTVRIFRAGRQVATVAGARARQLIPRLGISTEQDQQLLARATGNYKQGNERRSTRNDRRG